MTDAEQVKLYFEEIPVQDDHATSTQVGEGIESILLKGGGELQTVQFGNVDSIEQETKEESNASKSPVLGTTIPFDYLVLANDTSPTPTAHKPTACGSASICQLGESIFLFGGANREQQHFNDLWHFNLHDKAWYQLKEKNVFGNPPSPRSGHSVCALNQTTMVLFGGMNLKDAIWFDDLHVLQVVTSDSREITAKWLEVQVDGHGPQPRAEHSLSAIDDYHAVLHGGSSGAHGVVSDTQVLELTFSQSKCTTNCPQSNKQQLECTNKVTSPCGATRNNTVQENGSPTNTQNGPDVVARWTRLRCTGDHPEPREMHSSGILYSLPDQTINTYDTATSDNSNCTNQFISENLASTHNTTQSTASADRHDYPRTCKFVVNSTYKSAQCTYNESRNEGSGETDGPNNEERAKLSKSEGNVHFIAKDYQRALECYTEAIQYNPLSITCFGNRSACYLHLDQPENALRDAFTAISINPNWPKGHFREYSALIALGRYQEALQAIQSAVELAANDKEMEQYLQVKQKLVEEERSPTGDAVVQSREGPFLVVYGGRGVENVIGTVHVLDLATNVWRLIDASQFQRCGHSMVVYHGRWLHIFGGIDSAMQIQSSSIVFDLASEMWTECESSSSSSPRERFAQASCLLHHSEKMCENEALLLDERGLQSNTIKQHNSENNSMCIFGGVNIDKDLGDLFVLQIGDLGDCI